MFAKNEGQSCVRSYSSVFSINECRACVRSSSTVFYIFLIW